MLHQVQQDALFSTIGHCREKCVCVCVIVFLFHSSVVAHSFITVRLTANHPYYGCVAAGQDRRGPAVHPLG